MRIFFTLISAISFVLNSAHAADRYRVSVVPDPLGLGVRNPLSFADFNGELYFRGITTAHGSELFKFDGSGVSLVSDTLPGPVGGNAFAAAVFQGNLYFNSTNGVTGYELYKFDGSNVSLVADMLQGGDGSLPLGFAEFKDKLLFCATTETGRSVYSFDGTSITPILGLAPTQSLNWAFNTVQLGEKLLFGASGGSEIGFEMFAYDGVSATLVSDIYPGVGSSEPQLFIELGGKVVFTGDTGAGRVLLEYDGISVKQVLAGVAVSAPRHLTKFRDEIYFSADGGPLVGTELFKYDGNAVSLVANINAGLYASNPSELTVFDDSLFFRAVQSEYGSELFRFDGDAVSLVKDIKVGPGDSTPTSLFEFNGELFFSANSVLTRVSVVPEPSLSALVYVVVVLSPFWMRQYRAPMASRQ